MFLRSSAKLINKQAFSREAVQTCHVYVLTTITPLTCGVHCSYSVPQELLTELPNDACAIPEPLDIPAIMEAEDRFDSLETPPASASIGNVGMDGLHRSQNISGADQTRVHAGRDRWACPLTLQLHYSVVLHHSVVRQFAEAGRMLACIFLGRKYTFIFRSSMDMACIWTTKCQVGPQTPLPYSSNWSASGSVLALYPCLVRRTPFFSPRRYPLSLCLFDVDDVRRQSTLGRRLGS